MKNPAACKLLGAMLFLCCSLAAYGIADAFMFAGNGDMHDRYLRLGELALENDDPATAADFLGKALPDLNDPQQRRMATDLLHESLLKSNKQTQAETVLQEAGKSAFFAGHEQYLRLMQARELFYSGKLPEAIALLKELTVQLLPGDRVCFRALELLGKALSRGGDYRGAQKSYADMAAIAGNNALWKLKALEGLIFHALDGGDLAMANRAWNDLSEEIPPELQDALKTRLQKLKWLLDCHAGKSSKLENEILQTAASTRLPDPLMARIAYTVANEATDNYQRAIKFARMAYKFAEGAFRENALLAVIELEVTAGMWDEALKDCRNYLEIFSPGSYRHRVMAVIGSIYVETKKDSEAIKTFRKIYDDPAAPADLRLSAAESLAALYQKNALVNEASAMYKFAIQSVSGDAERQGRLLQEYGEYLYRLGRGNEALEALSQAAALQWKGRKNSGYWQAQTLYQLKKYREAQAIIRNLLPGENAADNIRLEYLDSLLAVELETVDKAISKLLEFEKKHARTVQAADALFQAGVLAMRSGKYDAAEIFQKFARLSPGEKAANALYKALNEVLNRNDEKAAGNILQELDKKYPDSKFTIGSHFRWLDHLREHKRFDDAAKTLAVIEKRYGTTHPELMPEILYDRAEITRKLGDMINMQNALETLLKKYADQPVAPQAFFLLGDLKISKGDFAGALAAFQQARERSSGIFRSSCIGRAADAAYALYTQTRQEQYLTQAREGYSVLLKTADLPPGFRQQSLYKLGRCLENASDIAGALHQYRELLYSALLAKHENRYLPPIWSAKALDAALKLLLPAARESASKKEAAALLQEAERLLKTAGKLDLPGENITKQLEAVSRLRSELN